MHHLLFISGLLLPVLVVSSQQYPYISKKMSWMEAQKFCRETFSDLATVNTKEDMSGLLRIILAAVTQNVYIGLYRSGVFTWHWTLPGNGYLEFQNWKAGQPKVGSEQDGCAGMDQNGEWFEDSCSTQRTFVCTDVNSGTYILVPISKSWRDAQEHCRGFYTELASAMNSSENQKIKVAAGSQQVWIGLFKDSWVWSDSSGSSFRFWNTNQPSNIKGQDCMVVTTNPTGRWNDVSCANANFFICQGDLKTGLALQSSTSPPSTPTQIQTSPTSSTPTQIQTSPTSSTPTQNQTSPTSSTPTQIQTSPTSSTPTRT
uniref:C-type lectin domain-containing protein n=1 Tax=Astyanax mexicanus TaxID=7994 RepID=W5LKC4_ASTMX